MPVGEVGQAVKSRMPIKDRARLMSFADDLLVFLVVILFLRFILGILLSLFLQCEFICLILFMFNPYIFN